jgi:hypothetical protein
MEVANEQAQKDCPWWYLHCRCLVSQNQYWNHSAYGPRTNVLNSVIITSIIRFVALLSIDTTDLTFTQVDAGIWTYMEIGIGIACANLPLLRPLFKRFFDRGDTLKASSYGAGYNYGSNNARSRNANISALGTQNTYRSDGFERMIDKNGANIDVESLGGSGSEVELQQRRYKGEGIKVETNVQLQVEDAESQTGNSRTRTTTDVRGPKSPGF